MTKQEENLDFVTNILPKPYGHIAERLDGSKVIVDPSEYQLLPQEHQGKALYLRSAVFDDMRELKRAISYYMSNWESKR